MSVVLVDGKSYVVNNTNDLQQILTPSAYEVVEDVMQEKEDKLIEELEGTRRDANYYELRSEDLNRCLLELNELLEEFRKYVKNAKRINRNKLMDCINDCLDTIQNEAI